MISKKKIGGVGIALFALLSPLVTGRAVAQTKPQQSEKDQAAAEQRKSQSITAELAVTSAGPLTSVATSTDLNCDIRYIGSSIGEFYGDRSCGTFISLGANRYGPSEVPVGPTGLIAFTPVSQVKVGADKIVTTVNAGPLLQLVQTDSYTAGSPEFKTGISIKNTSGAVQDVIVYRAADCYVEGSDKGFGREAAPAIGCVANSGQTAVFSPITAGSKYFEAFFGTVWDKIEAGLEFPNTCECALDQDNGAGLSWKFTIPANGTVQVDSAIKFTRSFVSIVSNRLVDTRPGNVTADGLYGGAGPLAAGSVTEYVVGGRFGVPNDATAAVLNVTATGATGGGYITVYPCGVAPDASNLNYRVGEDRANLVIAQLAAGGKICVFSSAKTNFIVDLSGFYTASSTYTPLAPKRVLNTRTSAPAAAGSTTEVVLTGVPATASTAVVNVTVDAPAADGYLTVYPCGALPVSSNVNFRAGDTLANLTVIKVAAGSKICIFSSAKTTLLADVNGYYNTGSTLVPISPARLLDTRAGTRTIDGVSQGAGPVLANSITRLTITGRAGIPASISTVAVVVTATGATAAGYVTVWPCGADQPGSSNLNYGANQDVPNLAISKVSSAGTICIFSSAPTQLIADITGYA